jgi:hypothetical protein
VTRLIKREIWIEETEVDIPPSEVMTIAQAARHLGVYTQAVSLALDRGDLTLLIDRDAPKRQGRRLVLRTEVEEWKDRRERRSEPEQETCVKYTWS